MKKGFTLIELLVVVLIMGILASVAMPQYFKSVEKSRASEGIDALSAIASAQERLFMQKGTFSAYLRDLDIGISNLTYFTVVSRGSAFNNAGNYARVQRKEMAGAGLGEYTIDLLIPMPGTGKKTWRCSPTSAGCNSFLPIAP